MNLSKTLLALTCASLVSLLLGATAATAAAKTVVITPADLQASPLPGPGQFLYTKLKRVELRGWLADGSGGVMGGTIKGFPGGASGFDALLATTSESWTAEDGAGRVRELSGPPSFFSDAERSRWEAAGSPPPADPVADRSHGPWKNFHFIDTTRFPTAPHQLLLAVKYHHLPYWNRKPNAQPLSAKETLAALWNIVIENPTTPQLRAAAFAAMGSLPGAKVNRKATDLVGRHGYAFVNGSARTDTKSELIYDPRTAKLLGERTVLVDPAASPGMEELPPGLTLRDTAYLKTGLVGSTDER